MKAIHLFLLSLTTSLAPGVWAQAPRSAPVTLPEPASTDPIPPPVRPSPVKEQTPPLPEKDMAAPVPMEAPVTPQIPTLPKSATNAAKDGILLNFQGASLSDVLNYLSEAAGFVIVQEAQVSGTVNIVSRQAISPEEAVDLLNTVLVEKGFIAIRNGRILKIVNKKDALKRDLPVQMGSEPDLIPRKDQMVTQILPLRYGEAAKLIENLRPLLADSATISANEGSNSILLTDTQTNIRRIAQIIKAIDTSVSNISTIQVFPLQFADSKQLATMLTQLFANNNTANQSRRGGRGFGFPFGGPPGGGDQGGGGGGNSGQSEAKQAASRIVAVADEQSNSVIVSAPEDTMPQIAEIIGKLDTSINDVTETRIFRLEHADAVELAEIVNNLYGDAANQTSQNRNGNNQNRRFGGFGGGGFGGGQGQGQSNSNQQSERALLQSKVVAVGDPRTNSLVVTAARDTMSQISETVGRLDATDAKRQRVYVHSLEHADADSVANVLRGMLGDQTAVNNASRAGSNRLSERSATGANMETSDTFGGAGGGGARGGAR